MRVALGLLLIPVVGAEPATAAAPSGNGLIAFTSDRAGNFEIYVIDADGTNPQRLTDNAADDREPAWSPDGTRIAFASNRDGNHEIYVMNADGTDPRRLTNHPAFDQGPAWSPDGTRIGFTSLRDGNAEIYVMNADGTDPRRLTNHPASDSHAAWSSDGTQIAFESFRDGNHEIYVMDADGTNPRNLTSDPVAGDRDPVWSPDGTQIAFTSSRDGNLEIYAMGADGSNPRRLTNDPAIDGLPDWQPIAPPVVVDDTYDDVARASTYVSPHSVLANDEGPVGMTAELAAAPTLGTLALAADGTFTYTLADPFTAATSDTFRYRACTTPDVCSPQAAVTLRFDDQPAATTLEARPPVLGFLSVTVQARLTVATTGAPVAGQPIALYSGSTHLCTSHTNATGTATCGSGISGWLAVALNRSYRATFSGNDAYRGSVTSAAA